MYNNADKCVFVALMMEVLCMNVRCIFLSFRAVDKTERKEVSYNILHAHMLRHYICTSRAISPSLQPTDEDRYMYSEMMKKCQQVSFDYTSDDLAQ